MALEVYKKKRDFQRTTEPSGDLISSTPSERFVVQEHHASHLHYDFRFELDGVLKSFAVPKGFPPAPGIRRLAIKTEDHPIEYLTFSGTIPDGNYGAGEMSIWDSGEYHSVSSRSLQEGLDRGKLELLLKGAKLNGQYDMIRTDDEKNEWLIIKTKDRKPIVPASSESSADHGSSTGKVSGMPDPIHTSPMLADTGTEAFDSPDFQFEIKWDGYRSLLFVKDGKAEFYSRNHQNMTPKLAQLTSVAKAISCSNAVIDGEIVALDESGLPSFQGLQNAMGMYSARGRKRQQSTGSTRATTEHLVYMAFDVLYVDGMDLTSTPLSNRRAILKEIIKPGGPLKFSDHVDHIGTDLFQQAASLGLEGVMAKRINSKYVQHRSADWVKIKVNTTVDAVIGGYTESPSKDRAFGALILGLYDGERLIFIGHVGTGFDDQKLSNLMKAFHPLASTKSPFAGEFETNDVPHWLKPEIVCECKYTTVSSDNRLRHPVFLHLRPDKPADACTISSLKRSAKEERGQKSESGQAAPGSIDLLHQADEPAEGVATIDHHRIKMTHLDKLFWKQTGSTKRDLLRYYADISPWLLPHLIDRPLVVQRYPDGAGESGFFQHDIGTSGAVGTNRTAHSHPSFLKTYDIQESNGLVHYAVCNKLADLLYLVNLGTIPLHLWNITTAAPTFPDRIVWDLDPGDSWEPAIDAALAIKEVLDGFRLTNMVKTSGANGLHIYVPIEPKFDSDTVSAFAKSVGEATRSKLPKAVTLERRIQKRAPGQVYLDCVQNRVGKTVVAPYSVRAMSVPSVSTPLSWDELTPSLSNASFTIDNVVKRVQERGDLFAGLLLDRCDISDALENLNKGK